VRRVRLRYVSVVFGDIISVFLKSLRKCLIEIVRFTSLQWSKINLRVSHMVTVIAPHMFLSPD